MLRRLFTLQWIGFLILLLLAVGTMTTLGLWQLNVSKDRGVNKQVAAAPTKPVVPIESLIKPHDAFPGLESSRRVSATGRYVPGEQLLVADRRLNGVKGYWVATPMVVQSTGARLVVVRGFVTSPSQASAPTATQVTVVGGLAPTESPSTATYPAGQIGSIDLAALVNKWPGDIYNAFVFGISEQPNATAADITRVPPPNPNPASGFKFVNLMYAFQWWMFAIFAVYVFWRMLRDDVYGPPERKRVGARTDNESGPGTSPGNDEPSKEAHV